MSEIYDYVVNNTVNKNVLKTLDVAGGSGEIITSAHVKLKLNESYIGEVKTGWAVIGSYGVVIADIPLWNTESTTTNGIKELDIPLVNGQYTILPIAWPVHYNNLVFKGDIEKVTMDLEDYYVITGDCEIIFNPDNTTIN